MILHDRFESEGQAVAETHRSVLRVSPARLRLAVGGRAQACVAGRASSDPSAETGLTDETTTSLRLLAGRLEAVTRRRRAARMWSAGAWLAGPRSCAPGSCAPEGMAALPAKQPSSTACSGTNRPNAARMAANARRRSSSSAPELAVWRQPWRFSAAVQGRRLRTRAGDSRDRAGWSSRRTRAAPCAISASTPPSKALSCSVSVLHTCDYRTGEIVRTNRNEQIIERQGSRSPQVHRADLQAPLMEAVRAGDPAGGRPGHGGVGLDQRVQGVDHLRQWRKPPGGRQIGADSLC